MSLQKVWWNKLWTRFGFANHIAIGQPISGPCKIKNVCLRPHYLRYAKRISTLPRYRDLASPLTRLWRKTCPTPLPSRGLDCHASSDFRLHSLSSWVSVALALAGPHPLAIQWIVPLLGIMSITCHYIEYSWQFFGLKSQYASNGGGVPP
jgi:hypothetical protein